MTHAFSHSACYNANTAKCAATSEAEQAESMGKHGPIKPSTYEMRPDAIDTELAVPSCKLIFSRCEPFHPKKLPPGAGNTANKPTYTPTSEFANIERY